MKPMKSELKLRESPAVTIAREVAIRWGAFPGSKFGSPPEEKRVVGQAGKQLAPLTREKPREKRGGESESRELQERKLRENWRRRGKLRSVMTEEIHWERFLRPIRTPWEKGAMEGKSERNEGMGRERMSLRERQRKNVHGSNIFARPPFFINETG